MAKQTIKSLSAFIILVLLVQTVSASAIAAIGMQGLSMASPELAEIVNTALCIPNPVLCLQGKIIGMVQGEALQALAEASPEIAKAVQTYNQVKLYVDAGAEITQDLQVNEKGTVTEGTIEFKEHSYFGNLIGEEIKQEEISGKEIKFEKKEGASTITFTGDESSVNVQGNKFENIKKQTEETPAYVKLNSDGEVIEADFTTKESKSQNEFKIGGKGIAVEGNTRVIYKDGKLIIDGEKDTSMYLKQDVNGQKRINIISSYDGNPIIIEGNSISGNRLEIRGLGYVSGKVSLVPEGYLLGEKSVVAWDDYDLWISAKENSVLLATSSEFSGYDNYILAEKSRLSAKGEGFQINFGMDNPYAKIDSKDNFQIKAINGFSLELENRDSLGKIPRMSVGGEFAVNQDYKSIYTENGEVMVKRGGVIFGEADKNSYTTPIELLIKDENTYRSEKYLVSNFKGIAVVPLDAEEGFTEEIYDGSIHHKKASVNLIYNYPTTEYFEKVTGKKMIIPGNDEDYNIKYADEIRTAIDILETIPNERKADLDYVKIWSTYDKNVYKPDYYGYSGGEVVASGWYDYKDNSINIVPERIIERGRFSASEVISHEMAHLSHDYLGGYSSLKRYNELSDVAWERYLAEADKMDPVDAIRNLPKAGESWDALKYLTKSEKEEYKKIAIIMSPKSDFSRDWLKLFEKTKMVVFDKEKTIFFWDESKTKGIKDREGAFNGFVHPYGSLNPNEDIVTYVQKIHMNPGFFKKNNLLGEGANPRYKQKIDLLHKNGFITDTQYDTVLNPEKYGLK